MTLLRTTRLVCLLLVATACIPLFLSGELPETAWLVTGLGLALGWVVGGRPWPRHLVLLLTSLLIAAMAFLLFLSLQTGDWLVNSIMFALLATVSRGLQLHSSRQCFQMIGLSFLLLIAAAVTNPDVSFAVFFVAYAVLLTWGLTFTHLNQQVEESGASSGLAWKAARFVSPRFLAGSSLMALLLLVASLGIFFLFPRLGLGFFSAQTRRGESITGFSDNVDLGHFGNLKDSSRVVLRVEIVSGRDSLPPATQLRFRGMAFDRYDGRGWHRSLTKTWPLRAGSDGFCEVWGYPAGKGIDYRMVEYDVYQEPLDIETRVLFGLDRPLYVRPVTDRFDRFRGRNRSYFVDEMHNLSYSESALSSISYTVRSGLLVVSPERLRALLPRYPRHVVDSFLQVPPDLDPRIMALAREIAAAALADNPYDVAKRIEEHLQSSYAYTTEGVGEMADPLVNFLFERKAGHCQYFATAMVVMLRTLGIPARPVNGFAGASYNEYGDYYTVTEGAAHTWVEVYFPKYGWIVFEPTPAVERLPGETGVLDTVALWLDAARLSWYKWVVEYDLERQVSVYASLWNALAPRSRQVEITSEQSVYEMRRELKKISRGLFNPRTALLAVSAVVALALARLAARWWRHGRRQRRVALDRLAAELRVVLKRKGFLVLPGATLPALARQAVGQGFAAAGDVAFAAATLEEARWSPAALPDLPALRSRLRAISASRGLPAIRPF